MSRSKLWIVAAGVLALAAVIVLPGIATARHHHSRHHAKRERDRHADAVESSSSSTSDEGAGTVASFDSTSGTLIINLTADLLYRAIDPRVQLK